MSGHRFGIVLSIVALSLVAAACGGPAKVKITYSQVANFYQMDDHDPSQTGPVTSSTAGQGEWILYRIVKIENGAAKKFVFDSTKVVTVTPDKTSADDMPNQYPFAGHLGTVTVDAGQTKDNPGCIVKFAGANDPKSLDKTSALVDVLYQLDADPKATMARKSGDSATQVLPGAIAWPELLAQKCAGN